MATSDKTPLAERIHRLRKGWPTVDGKDVVYDPPEAIRELMTEVRQQGIPAPEIESPPEWTAGNRDYAGMHEWYHGALDRIQRELEKREANAAREAEGEHVNKPEQSAGLAELTAQANAPSGGGQTERDGIIFHGRRTYSVCGGNLFVLPESKSSVLEAFLERPAMDSAELVKVSGVNDAPRVLRTLAKDDQLTPHITTPGAKSKGGYRVQIRQMPK